MLSNDALRRDVIVSARAALNRRHNCDVEALNYTSIVNSLTLPRSDVCPLSSHLLRSDLPHNPSLSYAVSELAADGNADTESSHAVSELLTNGVVDIKGNIPASELLPNGDADIGSIRVSSQLLTNGHADIELITSSSSCEYSSVETISPPSTPPPIPPSLSPSPLLLSYVPCICVGSGVDHQQLLPPVGCQRL